ncbi:MAG: putative N-acetylmannosamine-6-phosphate 2-epimerase [Acidimicrobiia bacterium]|nr:putative N-acetylmannosamine-6-phosphate 2-epimerase [Acidimicrobiia bacterium]
MPSKSEIRSRMRGGLIVSCQAEPELGSQLHQPEHIALIAKEVLDAGACAVRICGAANVKATRALNPKAIIIGIHKDKYDNGDVLITGTLDAAGYLIKDGADIVGLDMTKRRRPLGETSADVFWSIRKNRSFQDVPLMADLADAQEAAVAIELGVDFVATTLSGYTPDTKYRLEHAVEPFLEFMPDYDLVTDLVKKYPGFPIIAEGRWRDPRQCRDAIQKLGAFAVCVGSQVTRPRMIVRWHLKAIQEPFEDWD